MQILQRIPEQLIYALAGAAAVGLIQWAIHFTRQRLTRLRRRRRNEALSAVFDHRRFSIGSVQASIYVADFQPSGYDPHAVSAKLDIPTHDRLAPLRPSLSSHLTRWQQKSDQGEVFNGTVFALDRFSITRSVSHEHPGLHLQLFETNYVTQRAVADHFRGLPIEDKTGLIEEALSNIGDAGMYSSTFGVAVAVITADDKLVWLRRSRAGAVNPGTLTCTTAEGMNRDDVRSGLPDPFLCAARGLTEELGLRLSSPELAQVKLTALTLNLDWWEWNLIGHIDLGAVTTHDLDSHAIRQYFATARPKDKWETAAPEFVHFNPKAVAAFIEEHPVTNYAVVSAVFALLASERFRRSEVMAAFDDYEKPLQVGEG